MIEPLLLFNPGYDVLSNKDKPLGFFVGVFPIFREGYLLSLKRKLKVIKRNKG